MAKNAGRRVRVATLGAGGIARVAYLPNWAKFDDVQIAAVCDIEKRKAEEMADRFNIPAVYGDYKELLAGEKLDAVGICLPNYLHAPAAIAALKAGCHVLCDKPLALNAKEAVQMEKTAVKEKKKLMVGFTLRFQNDSRSLKSLIEDGRLGDIYYAKAGYLRRRGVPGFGGWFTTKAQSGGGGLIDVGVHFLDLTLWLMGHPRAVKVSGQAFSKFGPRALRGEKIAGFDPVGWPPDFKAPEKKIFDVDDLVTAFVRMDNGAVLGVEASWAANIDCDKGYSILMGTEGGASYGGGKVLVHTEIDGRTVDMDVQFNRNDGYHDEMRHFIDWITGGVRKTVAPARDGIAAMRIIDAIYESAKQGKEVAVKY